MGVTANTLQDDGVGASTWDAAALAAHQWGLAERATKLFIMAMGQKDAPCPIIIVRAKAGSVRDMFWSQLTALLTDTPITRLGPSTQTSSLYGTLDITDSLSSGQVIKREGLLSRAQNSVLLLTVADIAEPEFIRSLCIEIDKEEQLPQAIIAFDESDDDVIGIDQSLLDRAQFHLDLTLVDHRTAMAAAWSPLSEIKHDICPEITDKHLENIATHCAAFGLHSARPATHVLWLAKLISTLSESRIITLEHISQAIEISVLPRAKHMPDLPPQPEDEAPNPLPAQSPEDAHNDNFENPEDAQSTLNADDIPDEITPEIAQSFLSKDMLNALLAQGITQQKFARNTGETGRTGHKINPAERGAPKPSRKGSLHSGAALDLPATLRNAAPWQKFRQAFRKGEAHQNAIMIWPEDIHVKRYKHAPSSVLIFIVDASGSTALNRLSEAKGAMELLLGESYSRRDYVALLAFRKEGCDILLPPTRSLVRAKRELTSLSGGGGTPLAAGLQKGLSLAIDQKKAGREPTLILLTDGSANMSLSGQASRPDAMADAEQMAGLVAQSQIKSIIIDIGKRRQSKGKLIAEKMQGHYVALPFTSAETVSRAVKSAINT